MKTEDNKKIAVIGLGYVGLPLAVEFGKQYQTIGYDINAKRIRDLNDCIDSTAEIEASDFEEAKYLRFTNKLNDLSSSNIFIAAIPTPIDKQNNPDLTLLESACESIASVLKAGDTVIFESTVYPGTTDDICRVILEEKSGLNVNSDFFLGYSPERINPGDKENRITDIVKVTSGSCEIAAEFIDNLYSSIITAGTYRASSIKVAEAAKIIENTQRDVNIALMNELSIIFSKIGIDTQEVLDAAKTKWNFISYTPGLVGGHCIGVDPYYLAYKSLEVGHNPKLIISGRELNDSMGRYVGNLFVEKMNEKGIKLMDSNVLIMGVTFKENTPDIRNSRAFDIADQLEKYSICVDIYDPLADKDEVYEEYNREIIDDLKTEYYDGIIIVIPHEEFISDGVNRIKSLMKTENVLFDIKSIFEKSESDIRL